MIIDNLIFYFVSIIIDEKCYCDFFLMESLHIVKVNYERENDYIAITKRKRLYS